jgi:hypothetical protein
MRSTESINHIKLQEAYYALYERDPKPTLQKKPGQPVHKSPPIDPDVIRNRLLARLLGKQQDTQTVARLKDYVVKSGDAELVKLLFPDVDVNSIPKANPKTFEDQALAAFLKYNKELGYIKAPAVIEACRASEAFKNYLNIAKMVDYFANVIEGNTNLQDLSLENAYKMQVLFPAKSPLFKSFDDIFQAACKSPQNKALKDSHQPIHDLFITPLPSGITCLNLWRELIIKNPDAAPSVIGDVGLLPKIEKLWGETAPKNLTIKQFKAYGAQLTYARYNEAPDLAQFMVNLRIRDEGIFNRTLDLVKQGKLSFKEGSTYQFADKKDDKIPNITVAWGDPTLSDIAKKAEGYYWTKLPNGDPRGLVLGKILPPCCQFITGNSEKCVIDGMNRDNNGFYVLLKVKNPEGFDLANFKDPNWWKNLESHAQIKAQSYVWKSKAGNLCMDSLEGFEPNKIDGMDNKTIVKFLENFGEKLIDLGFDRLTIGRGGATPYKLTNNRGTDEVMAEGFQYGDSRGQAVLMESERLISKRQQISETIPNESMTSLHRFSYYYGRDLFISVKQADLFLNLPEDLKNLLVKEPKDIFDAFITSALHYNKQDDFNNLVESTLALKDSNPEIFNAIFSDDALRIYSSGYGLIADLKDLDIERIRVLTSENVIKACNYGHGCIADFKDLEYDKIKVLSSGYALGYQGQRYANGAYIDGYVSVPKLKDLSVEKIELFTSEFAARAFENDEIAFENTKAKELTQIYSHLFKSAGFEAKENDFDGFSVKSLKSIVGDSALGMYKKKLLSVSDLKGMQPDRIECLTSFQAKHILEKGYAKLDDLKGWEPEKIECIGSWKTIEFLEKEYAKFDDLKDLEPKKIKVYTSDDSMRLLRSGHATFEDLKNMEPEKVKALYFYKSLARYSSATILLDKGYTKFEELKNFEPDKIKALGSYSVLQLLDGKYTNFDDLKILDIDTIYAISSESVLKALSNTYLKFDDLKDLSAIEIKEKISAMYIESDSGNYYRYKNEEHVYFPDEGYMLGYSSDELTASELERNPYAENVLQDYFSDNEEYQFEYNDDLEDFTEFVYVDEPPEQLPAPDQQEKPVKVLAQDTKQPTQKTLVAKPKESWVAQHWQAKDTQQDQSSPARKSLEARIRDFSLSSVCASANLTKQENHLLPHLLAEKLEEKKISPNEIGNPTLLKNSNDIIVARKYFQETAPKTTDGQINLSEIKGPLLKNAKFMSGMGSVIAQEKENGRFNISIGEPIAGIPTAFAGKVQYAARKLMQTEINARGDNVLLRSI